MKKILFTAIFFFSFFFSFSQVEVKWGERFYDIKENCTDVQIIAEDIDGYYMWYCLNEYVGDGNFKLNYYMARVGRDKNINKIVKIEFPHTSFKIEQTWRSGDLVGFILSRVIEDNIVDTKKSKSRANANKPKEKRGSANLYVQFFHLKDMRLIGKVEKFKTYNYFALEGQKPYLFNFSENKQRLIFGFFTEDTASGRKVDFEIYDDRMRLLWEKDYKLDIKNDAYKIMDLAISNDGKKALLAVRSFTTGKKKSMKETKAHLIWFNEYEQRHHEQVLTNSWPNDFKCAFNAQDDYLMAGYYGEYEDIPDYSVGSFSFLYDNRRGFKKNSSISEFKEYETNDIIPFQFASMYDFTSHLDYIYPMVGGNVILVGEQRFKSTIKPPAKRGQKPTGEDANYYKDIILTNVDKTGFISGNAYIPKRQKTSKEGNEDYNSYSLTRDRFGMYLMFNDHMINYFDNYFDPIDNYNSDKKRTQVNFVQVFSDGSWRWHEAYNTKKIKMPFYKTLFLSTSKEVIFLGHFRDNNIIGSFETR